MSFKTENRKVSDLFEGQKIYYVPRYQRNYVWDITNWSELLADIKFTISESNTTINWSHFLGTIVLNKKDSNGLGNTEFEIIDGQQRLTTLFVILISICARLQALGEKNYAENIINTYIQVTRLDGNKQYKFVNDLLKPEFDKILQSTIDNTSVNDDSVILTLFNYYKTEFYDYDFDMLKTFTKKLLSINIVEIISAEDEEIYNIFEVLNARGQKLKQLELLKNRVMKYITPRENDVIDKTKKEWLDLENNLADITDTDVFLHHFVKCYIKKQADNKDSVYKLIKESVKIDEIGSLLNNLVEYASSYKVIYSKNNENHYIKYFDIKRNQQIRSILAALHKKLIVEFKDNSLFEKTLKELRNYFLLFNLTKQTSNKIDSIITDFAYKIYNADEKMELKICISAMFYTLNKHIANITNLDEYLSTNSTLKYSNKKQSGFTRNAKFVKYLLFEIYMQTESDTQINYEHLTIEHIYSDKGDEKTSSISNLTLLNKDFNEQLGDKSPKEKVDLIQKNSTIEENKKLCNFLNGDNFDLDKRLKWFSNKITSGDLSFKPNFLQITDTQVNEYFKNYEIVKENEILLCLLKKHGAKFEEKLKLDPNKKDLYAHYKKLKESM